MHMMLTLHMTAQVSFQSDPAVTAAYFVFYKNV